MRRCNSTCESRRCAVLRGALRSLINGAALKRVADLVREAEQRLHGGDGGIERRGTAWRAIRLGPHRFQRVLHVLHRGTFEARSTSREGFHEAATDALIGSHGMTRAIGVRFEPNRQEVVDLSMSFKSPEERRFEGKALRDHRPFVKAVREGAGR